MEWNHSVPELGIVGKMHKDGQDFVIQAIPKNLKGKSVLDLGAWDGYFSVAAAKRGAEPVVAIDNGYGEQRDFGDGAIERLYKKYAILNKKLGINITFLPMDIFEMDKILMKFDYIFCFGIYYHVKNIYGLFEKCYEKLNPGGTLLIEGHFIGGGGFFTYFYDEYELNNDKSNYWSPTEETLQKMLRRIGFRKYKRIGTLGKLRELRDPEIGIQGDRILIEVHKSADTSDSRD